MMAKYRKRHKPAAQRIKEASKLAGTIFVAIIAAPAALIAITGYEPSVTIASVFLAVAAIVSIVVGVFGARLVHIPDFLVPPPVREMPATCKICSAAELTEVNSWAAACYRKDAIPNEVVEQWRLKNPIMFACIVDQYGGIEAALGIMPLTKSFMDQFIAGKVVENQIGPEDILSIEERKRVGQLYISGVVVRDAGRQRGHMRAGLLLWATVQYLAKLYGTRRKRTLYALAATSGGERLLKRLNFRIVSRASQRLDRHDLYSLEWNKDTLNGVRTIIPDYRYMCTLKLRL